MVCKLPVSARVRRIRPIPWGSPDAKASGQPRSAIACARACYRRRHQSSAWGEAWPESCWLPTSLPWASSTLSPLSHRLWPSSQGPALVGVGPSPGGWDPGKEASPSVPFPHPRELAPGLLSTAILPSRPGRGGDRERRGPDQRLPTSARLICAPCDPVAAPGAGTHVLRMHWRGMGGGRGDGAASGADREELNGLVDPSTVGRIAGAVPASFHARGLCHGTIGASGGIGPGTGAAVPRTEPIPNK